jgi:hypothetical protein
LHEIVTESAANRRRISMPAADGSSEHRTMRWLSSVSLIPALLILTVAFPEGWRAAAAAEPRAAPVGLAAKLATLAEQAGGKVGVSVIHVESGQEVAVGGDVALPLYSVFKDTIQRTKTLVDCD